MQEFLNRPGGAIWRIFWLHVQHTQHFPIYDQHVHRAMAFLVEEPARYQLMFHRTIPGFTPSPESYAVSVEQLERARAWFARNGLDDPGALDLFTSLIGGLAGQQIANDPGGDHWVRLVNPAVDMFLTYLPAAGQATTRRTRERARS